MISSKVRTLLVVFLSFTSLLFAEVRLPALVSSNMVLQRNAEISLWGWADKGEDVILKASWLKKELKVRPNEQGEWLLKIETTNSREPQTIHIMSNNSNIKLENILFGEVWFCSGQSNMEMPVRGFSAQPVFGSNQAIAKANNANIRFFSVKKQSSQECLNNLNERSSWCQASPTTVSDFSAVAYFFGKQLNDILDVPVGLILSSWGGSRAEAWMSHESLMRCDSLYADKVDATLSEKHQPTLLFNAMVNPLIPYTIKGALWYQGESNRSKPKQYKTYMQAMVEDWRLRWHSGEFPFYFVQISPFKYKDLDAFNTVANSAFMREAQMECVKLIPNSGIAITLDLGDDRWIHPPYKEEVANRLLYCALNQTYGFEAVPYCAPEYTTLVPQDTGLLVRFKNVELGLYCYDELENFEIAGEDRVFYPAKAIIKDRSQLFVSSQWVAKPVAVRYAWSNWVSGSLFGANLLPVSSFRTDNWEDAVRYQQER